MRILQVDFDREVLKGTDFAKASEKFHKLLNMFLFNKIDRPKGLPALCQLVLGHEIFAHSFFQVLAPRTDRFGCAGLP
jgi:hypothetical protein